MSYIERLSRSSYGSKAGQMAHISLNATSMRVHDDQDRADAAGPAGLTVGGMCKAGKTHAYCAAAAAADDDDARPAVLQA